jgi:sucrose-6-phosphate hydrolase SacC (GH32 family)
MDGVVRLRILLDRGSAEIFANDGRVAMSVGLAPDSTKRRMTAGGHGGPIVVQKLDVHELRSAWR